MEIKKLTKDDVSYIYENSMTIEFPPEELKPLHSIHTLMQEGDYECMGLYRCEQLCGYGFFQKTNETDYILLDYLVILTEYRSQGFGSKFLKLLQHYYKSYKGIVVEAEELTDGISKEEMAIRSRRFGFYRNVGFKELRFECCIFNVPFKMFVFCPREQGSALIEQEVAHAEAAFYRRHLPAHIFEREVHIQLQKEKKNG